MWLLPAELQLQFRFCISAFHLLSHLFLLFVSLLSVVSSVSQFIQFLWLTSQFSIITVLIAVKRAEKPFTKWVFFHNTFVLCLVHFCLCLVLHVVSSGKREDVCIMCVFLELFNFWKHLYSTLGSTFGAGTDCDLKQRTSQCVDSSWRSWRTGRAWPSVLPSSHSPQPLSMGTCLGAWQKAASGSRA